MIKVIKYLRIDIHSSDYNLFFEITEHIDVKHLKI